MNSRVFFKLNSRDCFRVWNVVTLKKRYIVHQKTKPLSSLNIFWFFDENIVFRTLGVYRKFPDNWKRGKSSMVMLDVSKT
mmetsp:Transcript_53589/g.62623  ORF Transcript_53589/g.62623 Transcript_53589/m.62623 type:complete len:80 (+) Transcript_53589:227-466(+)